MSFMPRFSIPRLYPGQTGKTFFISGRDKKANPATPYSNLREKKNGSSGEKAPPRKGTVYHPHFVEIQRTG
jgi:hypothetical protein